MIKPTIALKNSLDSTYLNQKVNGSIVKSIGTDVSIQKVVLVDSSSNPVADINDLNPLVISLSSINGIGINSNYGVTPLLPTFGTVTTNGALDLNSAVQVPRTPTVFTSVQVGGGSGSTQIRTSAVGKKFRLMGGVIICAAGLAAAGVELCKFLDVAADLGIAFQFYCPTAANLALGVGSNSGTVVQFDLKPNGVLMAATNTAFNLNTSAAITAGAISVTVWGTEE